MSVTQDLEQRLADHYAAAAPSRAPDWVLERILATVETGPQRQTVLGRPWRVPRVHSTSAKLSVAAVVIAAVGLAGLTLTRLPAVGPTSSAPPSTQPASPSPSPTSRPSPRPGFSRFDSTINGVSIDHPSGWQVRPATEPWSGGELSFDSPAADVIFDPAHGKGLYILLASESYAAGNGDAWKNAVLGWTCRGYRGGEGWGWRVDGAYAWQQAPCNSDSTVAADFSGSIVATDTRGYLIRLVASKSEPGVADYGWDWLKPLLDTADLADSASDERAASALPGTWEATDAEPDSSHLTMDVVAQGDGSVLVTVHDDHASVCGGGTSTMTGRAEAQHGTMVIAEPTYVCDDGSEAKALSSPPLDERLRDLRFIYDAADDQLDEVAPGGPTWSRVAGTQ